METWAWLAVYFVGFALLQLVLYRYFQRGESTHEGEAREPGYKRLEAAGSAGVDEQNHDHDEEMVVCTNCGTLNERHGMFSYCRECADPLR